MKRIGPPLILAVAATGLAALGVALWIRHGVPVWAQSALGFCF